MGDARIDAAEEDARVSFAEFWSDIVCPGGLWDHDQVMRELHDYRMVLDNVPKVYCHVTNGRVSKPNTLAFAVIGEADTARDEDIAEALKEAFEEAEEVSASECEKLRAALAALVDAWARFDGVMVTRGGNEEYREVVAAEIAARGSAPLPEDTE